MIWVLVGVRGCVMWPTGHSSVTLFFLSVSIKDQSLQWTLGKSQIYYPEHILGYGRRKTCCSLVVDPALSGPTDGRRRWWRSLHCTESGTQEWGLESMFGRGHGHPEQESDGLVLLVPRVQAGRVSSGHPAGGIDS